MTINSSRTFEFSIAQIVLLAHRKAGLLNVYEELDEERAGAGRLELEMLVDSFQAKGQLPMAQGFVEIALVVDQIEYDLPADALHPTGPGMYIPAGQTLDRAQGETHIEMIDSVRWQSLSPKGAKSSRPSLYFVNRTLQTVKVKFWPIPQEAGTVRLLVDRLRADSTDGSKTPDFERYWSLTLTMGLAYHLAMSSSMPLGKVALLKQEYEMRLAESLSTAKEQPGWQMHMTHYTPWRR